MFYLDNCLYICIVQNTIQAMNKSSKKRINFNQDILSILQKRYGYSLDYIRKSLKGDRVGIMPDTLIKEYNKLESASKKAIQQKEKDLN